MYSSSLLTQSDDDGFDQSLSRHSEPGEAGLPASSLLQTRMLGACALVEDEAYVASADSIYAPQIVARGEIHSPETCLLCWDAFQEKRREVYLEEDENGGWIKSMLPKTWTALLTD